MAVCCGVCQSALRLCYGQGGILILLFLCNQGINRLGKAAPRPGSLRPPDPNKYRTMDMFSEDTDNDKDYQKMVQDVRVKPSIFPTLLVFPAFALGMIEETQCL